LDYLVVEVMPPTRIPGHQITTAPDPQAGGWMATCICGWRSKRPNWYRARAAAQGIQHLEEVGAAGTAPHTNRPLSESEVQTS